MQKHVLEIAQSTKGLYSNQIQLSGNRIWRLDNV